MRWFNATLLFASWSLAVCAAAEEPTPQAAPFQGKIVLFGAMRIPTVSGRVEILTLDPATSQLDSVLRMENVGFVTGRVSPDCRRLAFSTLDATDDKSWTAWIVDGTGERREIPGAGQVAAWSPDGTSLICFTVRDRVSDHFLVDVQTGKLTPLEIPVEDRVDDWAHATNQLSVTAANHEHTFEHPGKGVYPLRQIDVMKVDGTQKQRITKQDLLDNIWSRFSPNGEFLAHYQRRHTADKVFEYYVVRKRDGHQMIEVVRPDKLDEHLREVPTFPSYPYYWTPQGFPCWSPDGSCIAACLSNSKWARNVVNKVRFGLVFATLEGKVTKTLELDKLGVGFVCQIDWR